MDLKLKDLGISEEFLSRLINSTLLKAKEGNDEKPGKTTYIVVYKYIFIKWMCKRGEWLGYKDHISRIETEYNPSWGHPITPKDLLGCTSFHYETYKDWLNFVSFIDDMIIEHIEKGLND